MSKNLAQVYAINPVTTIGNTDLFYIVVGGTTDGGITGGSINAIYSPIAGSASLVTVGTITSGTWQGSIIGGMWGGTGVNNGTSTITVGGNVTFSGLHTFTGVLTGDTNVTFPTSGTLATTAEVPSLPLSLANGGTNANLTANNGGIFYSTATAGAILSGTATANQVLLSGLSSAPNWSTAVYPVSTTINELLYSSASNVITGLPPVAAAVLTTVASVPTWSAQLSLALGGTNAALVASAGGIVYSGATALAILSGTATGNQLLTSGASAAPSWTTATYPATTTANQILYSSATNTVTGLTSANSGVLVTSSLGVPSILTAGTTGQFLSASTSGTPAWSTATYPQTTTINQILYSSANNTVVGLTSANSSVLVTSVAGVPSLSTTLPAGLTIPGYQTSLTLPLSLANGGTNANLTANNGGIFYSTASAGAILSGTATAQQLLMSGASTTPQWSTTTYPTTNAINTLLYASSANVMGALATANSSVLLTNGSGVPAWASQIAASNLLPLGGSGVSFTTVTSYNLTTASGTQVITGVGFQPSLVIFFGNVNATNTTSWGWDNGTQPFCIFADGAVVAGTFGGSGASSMIAVTGVGAQQVGKITAFGADGFTITWTKTGSPTGTWTFGFLCFK